MICVRCHDALHGNPYVNESGERWDAERVRAALSSAEATLWA